MFNQSDHRFQESSSKSDMHRRTTRHHSNSCERMNMKSTLLNIQQLNLGTSRSAPCVPAMSGWRSNYSYGGGQGSNWRGNWQAPQPPAGPPPAKKAKPEAKKQPPKAKPEAKKQPPKPPGTGTCKADREKRRRPLIDELPVVRAELREQEDENLVRQTALQTKYELTLAMAETSQRMMRNEEDGQCLARATSCLGTSANFAGAADVLALAAHAVPADDSPGGGGLRCQRY